MSELRWILLGLGIAFCLGLWWWETRRRRQVRVPAREADSDEAGYLSPSIGLSDEPRPPPAPLARIEPTLDEVLPVGDAHLEPRFDGVQPSPAPADEPSDGDGAADQIVSLRVLAAPTRPFAGGELLAALQDAGLEHGKFAIFHKQTMDGEPIFSVASLTEPGSFDLQAMPDQQFRGITFFALADAAGTEGLADMHRTAREIAGTLHGTVSGER